jgi:putative ABC transport system permease protein
MAAIPIAYNVRSLRVRWRTTLATAFGIALVVAVFVMVMALARGLKSTYVRTGDPRNLLVLRRGSTAESSSQIMRDDMIRMKYLPGIARDENDRPYFSPEIIVLIYLNRIDSDVGGNVLVRGMGEMGLALRPNVRISEGRMFQSGMRECVVSRRIADRFENCRIGDRFRAGKAEWTVVGIFEADKTAYESEIWADADEVRDAFNRNFYGSMLLRPESEVAAEAIARRIESDRTLSARVLKEVDYYKEQTKTAGPIQFMGGFLATIMSIGAAFSAMNTMYAAVGARTREIGTLRVLGFSRRAIYASFILESILLATAGGIMGCAISLPLNGVATGTFSWTTFSEVAFEFRITPELLFRGMLFAIGMGIAGGLLPARMAAQKPVLAALKA